MLNDNNYITIQSFMVRDLGLKGNDLLVYAIIYGFSQMESQEYYGSLKYLMEWTNTTKKTMITTLSGLCERGLLEKREKTVYGIKHTFYRVNSEGWCKNYTRGVKITPGGVKITPQGVKITPNNINNNIYMDINNTNTINTNSINTDSNSNNNTNTTSNSNNYINNNIDYKYIIDYLNNKTNSRYRYNNQKTQRLVNARAKDGFSVEDFEKVISVKSNQWLGTDQEKYLRPETLFGTKFEGYLQEAYRELPEEPKKEQEQEPQEEPNRFDVLPEEIRLDMAERGVIDLVSESIDGSQATEQDKALIRHYKI